MKAQRRYREVLREYSWASSIRAARCGTRACMRPLEGGHVTKCAYPKRWLLTVLRFCQITNRIRFYTYVTTLVMHMCICNGPFVTSLQNAIVGKVEFSATNTL